MGFSRGAGLYVTEVGHLGEMNDSTGMSVTNKLLRFFGLWDQLHVPQFVITTFGEKSWGKGPWASFSAHFPGCKSGVKPLKLPELSKRRNQAPHFLGHLQSATEMHQLTVMSQVHSVAGTGRDCKECLAKCQTHPNTCCLFWDIEHIGLVCCLGTVDYGRWLS